MAGEYVFIFTFLFAQEGQICPTLNQSVLEIICGRKGDRRWKMRWVESNRWRKRRGIKRDGKQEETGDVLTAQGWRKILHHSTIKSNRLHLVLILPHKAVPFYNSEALNVPVITVWICYSINIFSVSSIWRAATVCTSIVSGVFQAFRVCWYVTNL